MRTYNLKPTTYKLAVAALVLLAAVRAGAQLTAADWAHQRGAPERVGANTGGALNSDLQQVYLWPNTRDLPPEIVVDDSPPFGQTYPLPMGQSFATLGTWALAPNGLDRSPGAWPPTDGSQSVPASYQVAGGYHYAFAVQDAVLNGIGLTTLQKLPNLGTGTDSAATYKAVNNELDETKNTTLRFARWSFGRAYPLGTQQGLRLASFNAANGGAGLQMPLQAGQRYAVYLRWPSTGTTIGGVMHPNTDNVMVRVSWGPNVNDPATSRIFVVNMGQTGGFWYRIATDVGDDRYFPYDGVDPIRVTLYTATPDPLNDPSQYPVAPLVSADAVRLVPEEFRGDVHDSAVSWMADGAIHDRLTYFGRDATVGPLRVLQNAAYLSQLATEYTGGFDQPAAPFTPILFDPTKPPDFTSASSTFNPIIPDPTTSIRSSVFYCLEDSPGLKRFGQLRWRYSANTAPVATSGGGTTVSLPTATVDDGSASFTSTGFTSLTAGIGDQAFGTTYQKAQTVPYVGPPPGPGIPPPVVPEATWTATLPVKGFPANASSGFWTGQTYTVMAWIPADPTDFTTGVDKIAHYAHYVVDTLYGPANVYVDQRMTANSSSPIGGWRVIATHVRFPFVSGNQVGVVHLLADAPSYPAPAVAPFTEAQRVDVDDVGQGRYVLADAVQFVPESLTPSSTVGSPQIAVDRQANGTTTPIARPTVHFVTDEGMGGHVWALDPLGQYPANAVGTSLGSWWTLTTAFWAYPSLLPVNVDPNYAQSGAAGNRSGIDGEWQQLIGGSYAVVNSMPALAGFRSSPVYIESSATAVDPGRTDAFTSYLLTGNQNGRLYGLNPLGRGDQTAAAADTASTPGTTQRVLTWPTTARDRFRAGTQAFSAYTNDPGKTAITAPPAARTLDAFDLSDLVVAGAGDGHVYALNPALINGATAMYNAGGFVPGAPLWQYPSPLVALDPITYTGAITKSPTAGADQYIFPAGGRIYGINIDTIKTGVTPNEATLRWVYPFANPENPQPGDSAEADLPFTSPAWQAAVAGLNGGNEVTYVGNQDGMVRALDSSVGLGGPPVAPGILWGRTALGPMRSSAVFAQGVVADIKTAADPNITTPMPMIFAPFDNGLLFGLRAAPQAAPGTEPGGTARWEYSDGATGEVPVTFVNQSGVVTTGTSTTSYVFRGADAATANGFVYNGDEGLLDTGEVNGQFHAYGETSITGGGSFVPYEPGTTTGNAYFDLRGGDLVLGTTYNSVVGGTLSGSNAMGSTYIMPNMAPLNSAVYDWGDSIYVVAWGSYATDVTGSMPTQVQFRVTGQGSNRTVTAAVQVDQAYNTSPGTPLAFVDASGTTHPAGAWVASAKIPLGLPSLQDSETPGSLYTVTIVAVGATNAQTVPTDVGARLDQNGAPITTSTPPNTNRTFSVAQPLALSTGGAPTTDVLTTNTNTIGWVSNTTSTNAWTQLLANGNTLATTDANGNVMTSGTVDLFAPVGSVPDGGTTLYTGVPSGNTSGATRVPALYVIDRSKMYLMNQRLRNVRVDSTDMAWVYDTTNSALTATGNVMNPLPWETFPNTVPNVSPDYPNIGRKSLTVRLLGADMSAMGTSPAPRSGGLLVPTPLDLSVTAPRYQPANVNAAYFNITGVKEANYGFAPMIVTGTGGAPASTPAQSAALFPSAGYVADARVYVGLANRTTFDPRFAYREMRVGIGIPVDMSMHTSEQTLDLGNAPHSLGYTPVVNGATTNAPFAPSDPLGQAGPYGNAASPFDVLNSYPFVTAPGSMLNYPEFFAPFTLVSDSNVNLLDLRVAKWIGNSGTSVANPAYWLRLRSDQVKTPEGPLETVEPFGAGQIFGVPDFPLAGAAGNIGVVSSLDHNRTPAPQIEMPLNMWPRPNPYVPAGNVDGWAAGVQPEPTLHKPRPNDPSGTTMTLPDVAYGDPSGLLTNVAGDLRPRIGIAVPLGTPAGTYSGPVSVYEDEYPVQWRNWLDYYSGATAGSSALDKGVDNGLLDVSISSSGATTPIEATTQTPFDLRITVGEAKLTNDQTRSVDATPPNQRTSVQASGAYQQADVRAWDATTNLPQGVLGGNVQPTAVRNPADGGMIVYWATNRRPAVDSVTGDPYQAPAIQDTPWLLTGSRLAAAIRIDATNPANDVFDWLFNPNASRWWSTPIAPYPDPASATPGLTLSDLFPSVAGVGDQPVPYAGTPIPNSVRQTQPALTFDLSGTPWLFWQGEVQKTGTGGSGVDTRTFYQQIDPTTGAPASGTLPMSFLNDPAVPKYAPKPIVVPAAAGSWPYLFWYGGPTGRTRLYYNVNLKKDLTVNPSTSTPAAPVWTLDAALPTPGALAWVADPEPIYRVAYNVADDGTETLIQAIDLVYSGASKNRNQAETYLTRYMIDPGTGELNVARLPHVDGVGLTRVGATQTWEAPDLAWLYQHTDGSLIDATDPVNPIIIAVNGTTVNTGTPVYDPATSRLTFTSALGGQLYVDPQAGTVTFPDRAPGKGAVVTASYTPRAMRLNVSRNAAPGVPSVAASGANTDPVAFLDLSNNTRLDGLYLNYTSGNPTPVTRLWLLYRKSGGPVTGSGALYYKTMRLTVQLPTAVQVNPTTGVPSVTSLTSSRPLAGPVEVDWVRGRLYFAETPTGTDEGNVISITYTAPDGSSHTVTNAHVVWADEGTTSVLTANQPAPETPVPTTVTANEGQIAAFKDPFQDKVWIFWSSTRNGVSDLYYEAISPKFYPQ